jgi:hypothetical protein
MTLGLSCYIAWKQVSESVSGNNEEVGTISEEQKEYYSQRFLAIRPIVGHCFTDQADLITPLLSQAKALEWIIYKDAIIQIQYMAVKSDTSNKSSTAAMVANNRAM